MMMGLKNIIQNIVKTLGGKNIDRVQHNAGKSIVDILHDQKSEEIREYIEELITQEELYRVQCQNESYLLAEQGDDKLYLGYYRDYTWQEGEDAKFGIYQGFTNHGMKKNYSLDDPKRYFKIHRFDNKLSSNIYENNRICGYFKIKDSDHLQDIIENSISDRNNEGPIQE